MAEQQLNYTKPSVMYITLKNSITAKGKDRYSLYLSSSLLYEMLRDTTRMADKVNIIQEDDTVSLRIAKHGLSLRQVLSIDKGAGAQLAAIYGDSDAILQGIRIEVIRLSTRNYQMVGVINGG